MGELTVGGDRLVKGLGEGGMKSPGCVLVTEWVFWGVGGCAGDKRERTEL